MKQKVFECAICCSLPGESAIREALERELPFMKWEEGDSSWDKVRVTGTSPRSSVRIYRYESPGPFQLTISFQEPEKEDVYCELRGQVLDAIDGTVWTPLKAQKVTLTKMDGRFPASYEFECDCTLAEIKRTLDDAAFWFWEDVRGERGVCVEGRIPFTSAGRNIFNEKERVRISGEKPRFLMEVGRWEDDGKRVPKCDEVHEIVQSTILPAIGARKVRGVSG